MRQDVYGEALAAFNSFRSAYKNSAYMGFIAPAAVSGQVKMPQFCQPIGTASATTGATQYCSWVILDRIETWAGVQIHNSGTGDSGDKARVAIYDDQGALQKYFGEVTFDGTSALRQIASSWTNTKLGPHELRVITDNAVSLYEMSSMLAVTGVGWVTFHPAQSAFPRKITTFATALSDGFSGHSVAGTYANFPESTALAVTAATNRAPAVGLYK